MNRKPLLIAAGVVLALFVGTVLVLLTIQGGYDSTTEFLLRNLHLTLLAVAIPLAVFVEAVLFYTALKYHGNDTPQPTEESRRLEVAWTVGVGVILVFVAATSYVVMADPMVSTPPDATPEPDDVVVEVTGQNWFWSVSYPGENVTTKNELVVPVNRTIFLEVASRDVVHSVHVPALGIKQDAIPGQTNPYRTRITAEGTYRLYCAEFCGAGHSTMLGTVEVVTQDEFESWLAEQRGASGNQPGP